LFHPNEERLALGEVGSVWTHTSAATRWWRWTGTLDVPGGGVLSAAVIVGETAGAQRFRSKDAYALFIGIAPIPVWSGNTTGTVRLNRGNRAVNCALHMIAVIRPAALDRARPMWTS
jgi:transposase